MWQQQATSSFNHLANRLDAILDTTTHHSHWQIFRGITGYRITVFLPADWLGALNTKTASGIVYLEPEGACETLAEALAVAIDQLLDTVDSLYRDADGVAA